MHFQPVTDVRQHFCWFWVSQARISCMGSTSGRTGAILGLILLPLTSVLYSICLHFSCLRSCWWEGKGIFRWSRTLWKWMFIVRSRHAVLTHTHCFAILADYMAVMNTCRDCEQLNPGSEGAWCVCVAKGTVYCTLSKYRMAQGLKEHSMEKHCCR